jgi:hypothetical protein
LREEIFKEKQLKKTIIESVIDPVTDEIVGAVRINNENKVDKIFEVDSDKQPIIDNATQELLKNEQEEFKVLDPVQLHAEAVKRNHTPQLPNESVPMDPKARVKLSKPSEAPSMFSEDTKKDAKDNS